MRIGRLDGLRGIAALMVVFSHLATSFRPQMFFGLEKGVESNFQTWFATSPLFLLVNGSFAVYIFFVLSGFVISASADQVKSPIFNTVFARYVRLSITPAVSIMLAVCFVNFGLPSGTAAAQLLGHWWVEDWPKLDIHQSWTNALKDALGYYYITGLSYFNGVVWTMQKELLGSIAIYIVFYNVLRTSLRLIAGIVIAIAVVYFNLTPYYYLCFVAGSFLYMARDVITKQSVPVALTALLAGMMLGGKPFFKPPIDSFYDALYGAFAMTLGEIYIWPIGAILVVFGILAWSESELYLGNSFSRFLGRVSFSVYLLHFPLLTVLMTNWYVQWGHFSNSAFIAIAVVYILVVYAFSFLITILVDEPAIKVSRWLKNLPSISVISGAKKQEPS